MLLRRHRTLLRIALALLLLGLAVYVCVSPAWHPINLVQAWTGSSAVEAQVARGSRSVQVFERDAPAPGCLGAAARHIALVGRASFAGIRELARHAATLTPAEVLVLGTPPRFDPAAAAAVAAAEAPAEADAATKGWTCDGVRCDDAGVELAQLRCARRVVWRQSDAGNGHVLSAAVTLDTAAPYVAAVRAALDANDLEPAAVVPGQAVAWLHDVLLVRPDLDAILVSSSHPVTTPFERLEVAIWHRRLHDRCGAFAAASDPLSDVSFWAKRCVGDAGAAVAVVTLVQLTKTLAMPDSRDALSAATLAPLATTLVRATPCPSLPAAEPAPCGVNVAALGRALRPVALVVAPRFRSGWPPAPVWHLQLAGLADLLVAQGWTVVQVAILPDGCAPPLPLASSNGTVVCVQWAGDSATRADDATALAHWAWYQLGGTVATVLLAVPSAAEVATVVPYATALAAALPGVPRRWVLDSVAPLDFASVDVGLQMATAAAHIGKERRATSALALAGVALALNEMIHATLDDDGALVTPLQRLQARGVNSTADALSGWHRLRQAHHRWVADGDGVVLVHSATAPWFGQLFPMVPVWPLDPLALVASAPATFTSAASESWAVLLPTDPTVAAHNLVWLTDTVWPRLRELLRQLDSVAAAAGATEDIGPRFVVYGSRLDTLPLCEIDTPCDALDRQLRQMKRNNLLVLDSKGSAGNLAAALGRHRVILAPAVAGAAHPAVALAARLGVPVVTSPLATVGTPAITLTIDAFLQPGATKMWRPGCVTAASTATTFARAAVSLATDPAIWEIARDACVHQAEPLPMTALLLLLPPPPPPPPPSAAAPAVACWLEWAQATSAGGKVPTVGRSALPAATALAAAAASHVLVMHEHVPHLKQGGDHRILQVIGAIARTQPGARLTFMHRGTAATAAHRASLTELGVSTILSESELVPAADGGPLELRDPAALFGKRYREVDVAVLGTWFYKKMADGRVAPSIPEAVLPYLRQHVPRACAVVLSDDIHALRNIESRLCPSEANDPGCGARLLARELAVYAAADVVAVVSPEDARLLAALGVRLARSPVVLPYVTDERWLGLLAPPFAARSEPRLLFVGSTHTMNRRALDWFLDEVFPRVLVHYPGAVLHVVGHGWTQFGYQDRCPRCNITGVEATDDELAEALQAARVFVAPIRALTGVSTKNLLALASGVPLVTTSHGAQGLLLGSDAAPALVADEPADFAAAVRLLLTSAAAWTHYSDLGRNHAATVLSRQRLERAVDGLFQACAAVRQHRP